MMCLEMKIQERKKMLHTMCCNVRSINFVGESIFIVWDFLILKLAYLTILGGEQEVNIASTLSSRIL